MALQNLRTFRNTLPTKASRYLFDEKQKGVTGDRVRAMERIGDVGVQDGDLVFVKRRAIGGVGDQLDYLRQELQNS